MEVVSSGPAYSYILSHGNTITRINLYAILANVLTLILVSLLYNYYIRKPFNDLYKEITIQKSKKK